MPEHASPSRAFDSDACTVWNSGGAPPQAIRASIDGDSPVTGVVFIPEMTPNGDATHVLTLDDASYVVQASFVSGLGHVVVFDRPTPAKTITVRTTASPSWVAWRAIVPITCESLELPSTLVEASPITPRPTPVSEPVEIAVAGAGPCKTDDDCVPATCCHPRTCNAKSRAPSCAGVGCAQNVVPGTIGNGARCACIRGTCGALDKTPRRSSGGLL